MFDSNSRYVALQQYTVVAHRSRTVSVVPVAPHPNASLLGIHRRIAGQRLDHLAYLYFRDATMFWRIAEENGVMLVEALSEATDVRIPGP